MLSLPDNNELNIFRTNKREMVKKSMQQKSTLSYEFVIKHLLLMSSKQTYTHPWDASSETFNLKTIARFIYCR